MKLKRGFILLLTTLLISVLMGTYMQQDTGYVRISISNYLIETSLWFAIIAFIVLLCTLYVLSALVSKLLGSTKWFNQWSSNRGQKLARKQTTRGLLAYAEGNWQRAQKYLTHSASKADTPLINYLAAAQAAHEQGHENDAESLLKKAYESTPGADMAVGITQAQLQLANCQYEQCLATLVRLRKKSPHHPFILKLLKTVYSKLQDWLKLTELLPELRKAKIGAAEELDELERTSWLHLLSSAVEEIKRSQGSSYNTDPLDALWDKLPASMRKDELVIHSYANHLRQLGESQRAEALIRKVLKNQWSPLLVNLYGLLDVEAPSELLLNAENWLKSRPNDDELLLTLGRLSMRSQLWGKAREYFESSLKLKKRPETFAELCRLYSHLGEHQLSSDFFMLGLISQIGLPDLPMPQGDKA